MAISSAKEIIEFIISLETRFKPQKWSVKDIYYWPLLRIEIYHRLSLHVLNSRHSGKSNTRIKTLINLIYSFFELAGKKKTDYLFVSDNTSFVKINGTSFDKFCDPIISELVARGKSWQKWHYLEPEKHRKQYNSYGIQKFFLILSLRNKFFRSNPKTPFSVTDELRHLLADVNAEINDTIINAETFAGIIQKFIEKTEWFEKRLIGIKPKKVFIVDYYNFNNMALINACNKLGIQSIDIQHGAQTAVHAAYANWTSIPENGYNLLPSVFLVWSDREIKLLKEWLVVSQSVYKTGDLMNVIYKRLGLEMGKMDEHVKNWTTQMKGRINVLFTLQYGLVYDEEMYRVISQTQYEYNWLIRLHPVDLNPERISFFQNELNRHGITSYEMMFTSQAPLVSILKNTDIHVTHSSSTILEALRYGIKSIVINEYGKQFYADSLQNEDIIYCPPGDGLIACITENAKNNIQANDVESQISLTDVLQLLD